MVRMTFFGARRVGLFAWLTILVSGCASILGNDFEVEEDAAAIGTGASGSTSTSPTSTGGAAGTGGSRGASGSAGTAGSLAGGSSGAGGSVVTAGASGAGGASTAGASGAGGASTAGASGAPGTGGSAGLDPDAGDSSVTPSDSSVADAATNDAPSDQSQGVDAASDRPTGSDSADVGSTDSGGVVDAPVCNPINGSCGGGGLTCNPGFASCNGSVTDGCECATPGCCGASCQVQHVACMLNGNPATPCADGTGVHFYDCVPQGTIDINQANAACAAVAGALSCSPGMCPGGHMNICSFDGVGPCVCWEYSGSNAGRVFKSNNANCFCPGAAAPTWN